MEENRQDERDVLCTVGVAMETIATWFLSFLSSISCFSGSRWLLLTMEIWDSEFIHR